MAWSESLKSVESFVVMFVTLSHSERQILDVLRFPFTQINLIRKLYVLTDEDMTCSVSLFTSFTNQLCECRQQGADTRQQEGCGFH